MIRLLEENIEVNLYDLGFYNGLLAMTSKEQETKDKIENYMSSQLKT